VTVFRAKCFITLQNVHINPLLLWNIPLDSIVEFNYTGKSLLSCYTMRSHVAIVSTERMCSVMHSLFKFTIFLQLKCALGTTEAGMRRTSDLTHTLMISSNICNLCQRCCAVLNVLLVFTIPYNRNRLRQKRRSGCLPIQAASLLFLDVSWRCFVLLFCQQKDVRCQHGFLRFTILPKPKVLFGTHRTEGPQT